jgi:uncharacterized membrane protein YfcA
MRVSLPTALAATCALLVGTAAVLPGWYRESWIWESPIQAAVGASLAVTASAGAVAVAVGARKQRVRHTRAVALGLALLALVILGSLLFMRSGASVIPIQITP